MKFLAISTFVWVAIASAAYGNCVAEVSLRSGAGWTMFEMQVAASKKTRNLGLMYQTELPLNEGMLFLYPRAGTRNFWMKNTPLSLDILYFDSKMKLVSVSKNTQPFDETALYGGEEIIAVVELNGGLFDDLGYKNNTKLRVLEIKGKDCPLWIFEGQAFSPKSNG